MKRILIVIDSLQCGGAERSLVTLLKCVSKEKYNIDLALALRGGELERELPDWINIIDIHQRKGLRSFLLRRIYSLTWRLVMAFKISFHLSHLHWMITNRNYIPMEEQYDVAISYQQGFPTYYIFDKVSALKKICWINTDLRKAGHNLKYEERYYKKADLVIAVSNSLRDAILKDSYVEPSRLRVLHDRIDFDRINNLSKEELPIDYESKFLIVMNGRLSKEKNYSLAIDVIRCLQDCNHDVCLSIIGEGPERQSLESKIERLHLEENIQLLGYQENPYAYMKASNLYLHISKYEGFGIALAEAKYLKCNILASDIPSFREQLRGYSKGRICSYDVKEIASCIEERLVKRQ